MKVAPLIIVLAAIPTLSLGVIDPQPNSIGVYFDLDADIDSIEVTPSGAEPNPSNVLDAYILLTNMTEPWLDAIVVSYRVVVPTWMEGQVFLVGIANQEGGKWT